MKKYKVTQEFMDALIEWRDDMGIELDRKDELAYVSGKDIEGFPGEIDDWWANEPDNPFEKNIRLIAIVQWLNGEDLFEVENPHKFLVRSVEPNSDGEKLNLNLAFERGVIVPNYGRTLMFSEFNSREEAKLWTTNGYEVVEIDGGGNEV